MLTECIAILAISICLIVILVRTGHPGYALGITPILVVPLFHLIAQPVSGWLVFLFPKLIPEVAVAFSDIASAAVSCLMLMAFSEKISIKKVYITMLGGYNIILTCAFVYQTLEVLWK